MLAKDSPDYQLTWERFLHQLRFPPKQRQVPFMALPVPEQFTPRSNLYDSIIAELLDETRANPRHTTVALYGAPGFGKTIMARALCHDPYVVEAFTGGILWATIGETGEDLTVKLNTMVSELIGSEVRFNTSEEAAARLHQLLADHDCLIVLDDVWQAKHLELFLGRGTSTKLITTRQTDIVVRAKAEPILIGEMEHFFFFFILTINSHLCLLKAIVFRGNVTDCFYVSHRRKTSRTEPLTSSQHTQKVKIACPPFIRPAPYPSASSTGSAEVLHSASTTPEPIGGLLRSEVHIAHPQLASITEIYQSFIELPAYRDSTYASDTVPVAFCPAIGSRREHRAR